MCIHHYLGKGSSNDERESAKTIAFKLKQTRPAAIIVNEGQESAEFWSAIGGKKEYASDPAFLDETRDPRLFQCSNASGSFKVDISM